MSAASNGAGSHFASGPTGDQDGRTSWDAAGSHTLDSTGEYVSASYQGFSFETPNGSHATINPSLSVPGSRAGSPSETDAFLAAVSQTQRSQEPARPAIDPSLTATIPASWNATGAGEPVTPAASAVPAPAAAPSRPVNPLVAARTAAGGQGGVSQQGADPAARPDGLFPIQEVEDSHRGGVIDLSFAEKGQKRGVLIIVGIVLLVALIVVGLFFGLRIKETADARANIDNAIDRLRDSDSVIVPLDTAIAAEISTGTASDSLANLMLQSSSTATALSDAESYASDAARSSHLLNEEENDAVAAVKSSVGARRSMLEIGRMLLSADTNASEALTSLEAAYANIADSNAKIQSSADQFAAYNNAVSVGDDTSGYDLWAIVQLDNDAVADLAMAQDNVNAAREAFPNADLTVLDNYLNARINQVNLLIQVDTCVASGDYDGANNLSAAYAEADANAQNAGSQVPATAAELLVNAYAQVTASQRDAYDAARSKCVDADATLNSYLGITDSRKEMGMTGDSAVAAMQSAPITDQAAPVEPAPEAQGDGTAPEGDGSVPAEGGEAPVEGETVA